MACAGGSGSTVHRPIGQGEVVADLGEEDFTMWVAGSVQGEQPVSRFAPKVVLVGELPGPCLERLVQVEERESLHSDPAEVGPSPKA